MADKIKCINCQGLSFLEGAKMAMVGFGICLKSEETKYVSPIIPRECVKFEQLKRKKKELNGW